MRMVLAEMAIKTRKRPGRPTKPAREGQKTTLSLRVDAELKQRLDDAGSSSGRNLSDEASRRLEGSFQAEDVFYQALDQALGRNGAAVIQVLARALAEVGHGAGFVTTSYYGGNNWLGNPYAFNQVSLAVAKVLEALRPEGDVTPPTSPDWPLDLHKRIETMGTVGARRLLSAVTGQGEWAKENDGDLGQWAAPVRKRLGPAVVERIKKNIACSEDGQDG
jgi:hypothetical protein